MKSNDEKMYEKFNFKKINDKKIIIQNKINSDRSISKKRRPALQKLAKKKSYLRENSSNFAYTTRPGSLNYSINDDYSKFSIFPSEEEKSSFLDYNDDNFNLMGNENLIKKTLQFNKSKKKSNILNIDKIAIDHKPKILTTQECNLFY